MSRLHTDNPAPADAAASGPTTGAGSAAGAGSTGAGSAPGTPAAASSTESGGSPAARDLAAELAAARAEITELRDAWLRAKAEGDNIRKQASVEREKTRKYAIESFAEGLLPVCDSLEATLANQNVALDTLRSGVDLTLKQLVSALEKAQVVAIDPAGEKFDPHRHQAMSMVASDQPANTVVQVFQKGYLLQDRVLRPALVAVAKGPDGS